jgi:HD-like signal output (HDOD) protein
MQQNSFYLEVIDELEDKFAYLSENAERFILNMQRDSRYEESVTDFFRTVHSVKALVSYAKIDNMHRTFNVLEDILSILRNKKPPVSQEVVDWLLLINDFLVEWASQVESGDIESIEAIDSYTLNMVKAATVSSKKPSEILKELTLVIIETDKNVETSLVKLLSKKVKKIYSTNQTQEVGKIFSRVKPDILITTTQIYGEKFELFVEKVQRKFINLPILFLSSDTSPEKDRKFKYGCIDCFIEKPFENVLLEKKLFSIAKKYYDKKEIKVTEHALSEHINNLKPLPAIVFELQNLLGEEECTVKDIAQLVAKDPVLTLKMLKTVNSALYNLPQEITSVQQAVSLLGKTKTSAICLQILMQDSFDIDLNAYGISQETFNAVSKKRLDLAMHWYSKVSFSMLPTLCTTALIGTLGQILIAQEIKNRDCVERFNAMILQTDAMAVEMEFLNTTHLDITADILEHWQLNPLLINSVRYAYDFTEADNEVKQYAVANYVVYNTITPFSDYVDLTTVDAMAEFLTEMNFDKTPYLAAIEKINR